MWATGSTISLWGELIRTQEQAEFMLFPRLLSAAERAWHVADWETLSVDDDDLKRRQDADWKRFVQVLASRELPRLDRLGIRYRIPPPGAKYIVVFLNVYFDK